MLTNLENKMEKNSAEESCCLRKRLSFCIAPHHNPSSPTFSSVGEGLLGDPSEAGVPRLVSEMNTSGCSSVVVTRTPLSPSEPHCDLGEGLVGDWRVSSRVCSSDVFCRWCMVESGTQDEVCNGFVKSCSQYIG